MSLHAESIDNLILCCLLLAKNIKRLLAESSSIYRLICNVFENWLSKIPNVPPNGMIVMDNAHYPIRQF